MDIGGSFAISAAGMQVEQVRFGIAALNLANANSTRSVDGALYQPLRVISGPERANAFERILNADALGSMKGLLPEVLAFESSAAAPRMMFDPGHPAADERGFVATPAVNTMMEMLTLTAALRAYEANVVALNAAKSMAMKAMEIGGNT